MTKNKIFLWVQTALCALIAILLAVAAVRIFLDGSAYQAAGHPSEWIYTREKAAAVLMPMLPLFLLSFAMTVYSLVKDIKDEEADKPVQDVERARDLVCARVAQPSEEMAKERALQKKLQLGGWIGFAVCMLPIDLTTVSSPWSPLSCRGRSSGLHAWSSPQSFRARACSANRMPLPPA